MNIAIQDNINIAHLLGEITALRDHDTALYSIEVTDYLSINGLKVKPTLFKT